MPTPDRNQFVSAVFITFSGNCRSALTHYQTCFGGTLSFEVFETKLEGHTESPVINGSLISDSITLHGSDLVHNEGRILGNYLSVLLYCKSVKDRTLLIRKLRSDKQYKIAKEEETQKIIELTDAYDVRWMLGV